MSKIKLNDLKKAAKAVCVLFWEDKTEDYEIDVKAKEPELRTQLAEATKQISPAEWESLDEKVYNTLKALASENKEAEAENLTLEEQVENADLDGLKAIVKADDTFKPLRKGIGIQKKADVLRGKMLELLNEEVSVPEKTSPKKDKPQKDTPKKDKPEKTPKAKKEEKMNRVASVSLALAKGPKTLDEWIDTANSIIEENGGTSNIQEAKYHARNIMKMAPYFDFGVEVPQG